MPTEKGDLPLVQFRNGMKRFAGITRRPEKEECPLFHAPVFGYLYRAECFRGKVQLIQNRYYNVRGVKWEARFFHKGEAFPETSNTVPRQGVWARPLGVEWDRSVFVAASWRFVEFELDLIRFPERKL